MAGPLRARPGADVLIAGGGAPSVCLDAVAAAVALGAGRVTTEVAPWDDAPAAVLRTQTKLVLERAGA